VTEKKKKMFREKEKTLIRFSALFTFGNSVLPMFELSRKTMEERENRQRERQRGRETETDRYIETERLRD